MHIAHESLEQVQEIVFGPIQVLDERDDRSVADEVAEELDPRVVERVAGSERVKLRRRVEAERESEDLPLAEASSHGLRRIVLADAEVLLEHFAERPIRDAPSVREAPAGARERLRVLSDEPLPELADEPGLADTAVTDDRDEVRFALGFPKSAGGAQ